VLTAPDILETKVEEMCRKLAGHAPLTMRAAKEAIRRLTVNNIPEGGDLIRLCYGSADFKEGVEAFLAKRTPEWRVR